MVFRLTKVVLADLIIFKDALVELILSFFDRKKRTLPGASHELKDQQTDKELDYEHSEEVDSRCLIHHTGNH